MPRPSRIPLLAAGLAATITLGPLIGPVALAADPTIVVRDGDTLTSIAERTGVAIPRLLELNGIEDPDRIWAGQRLRIGVAAPAPAAPAPAATAPAPRVHVVASGENLTVIARRYGVTLAAILAANAIPNPSRIFAGARITIPGTASASATAPTPAARPMSRAMAAAVAERDAVRRLITEEAGRFGVPVAFALAVAWQESGWRQGVTSYAGAVGVMQLLPSTAEWVGDTMLGAAVDVHEARANVRAGVRLLAHYLARYDGNRELVLAAYYQGQTGTDRHGVYAITWPYISSIRALERLFGG